VCVRGLCGKCVFVCKQGLRPNRWAHCFAGILHTSTLMIRKRIQGITDFDMSVTLYLASMIDWSSYIRAAPSAAHSSSIFSKPCRTCTACCPGWRRGGRRWRCTLSAWAAATLDQCWCHNRQPQLAHCDMQVLHARQVLQVVTVTVMQIVITWACSHLSYRSHTACRSAQRWLKLLVYAMCRLARHVAGG
jgi:hypothetical protein